MYRIFSKNHFILFTFFFVVFKLMFELSPVMLDSRLGSEVTACVSVLFSFLNAVNKQTSSGLNQAYCVFCSVLNATKQESWSHTGSRSSCGQADVIFLNCQLSPDWIKGSVAALFSDQQRLEAAKPVRLETVRVWLEARRRQWNFIYFKVAESQGVGSIPFLRDDHHTKFLKHDLITD